MTAEDGTLRRLLGVAEVVHEGAGHRLEEGPGPLDEAAWERGRQAEQEMMREGLDGSVRAPPRSASAWKLVYAMRGAERLSKLLPYEPGLEP